MSGNGEPPILQGRRLSGISESRMRRRTATVTLLVVTWLAALAGAAGAQGAADPDDIPPRFTNGECVVCHEQPDVVRTGDEVREGLLVSRDTIAESVHEDLTCTDCHSSLTSTMHPQVDRAAEACAGCHEDEGVEHTAGAHGGTSEEGTPPSCVTCHGNHEVTKAEGTDFDEQLAERCAACHAAMSERGFGSNPLGMETHLSRPDIATCDDCHEPHRVLPKDDPMSTVHLSNKLETCQRCHDDAGENFEEIQVHVASGPLPEDTKLRIATLWMLVILIFTFGFFGWLTVLGIRHEWKHGRHRHHHRPPTSGAAP
jgi:hypothetical protein